jgi:hypothetical protein
MGNKAMSIGNKFQESKTHCPQGHEYTPENTKLIKSTKPGHTKRQCRKCKNESASRRARAAKEAATTQTSEQPTSA